MRVPKMNSLKKIKSVVELSSKNNENCFKARSYFSLTNMET